MKNARFYFGLLVVYSLLATSMTVLLALRVDEQNRRIAKLVAPASLTVGEKAPAMTSRTADGRILSLRYGPNQKPKLVFVLRSTCPYSAKSMPSWKRISETASRNGFEVLGIVTDGFDGAQKVSADHAPNFDLTIFPNPQIAERFRVKQVPHTLLIDNEGTVRFSVVGLISESDEAELEAGVQP